MPPQVVDEIGKAGNNGVVISGVITWIDAQIETHGSHVWKSLAERCFRDEEVTAAKEALKDAKGAVLDNLVTGFKTNRKKGPGKKALELEDIRKAIVALGAAGEMPLVMATSSQMLRCPQSWGVPETATVQDVMGKVIELEKVMSDSLETQREQMAQLKQELAVSKKAEVREPSFQNITFPGEAETPSKKRKAADQGVSYAGIAGVHPLFPEHPGQVPFLSKGTSSSTNSVRIGAAE